MRNVILTCCLIVPPIYSLICKGCRNEECRYALLLLAMEVISFTLDLLGGSHWGYLLASLILSVLILETTIHAYLIKRSRIKSDAHEQHIVMEIVFSILQLIISCYCLIRALLGIKSTNFSSSVFPLAYATISVWFSFKNEKDVSLSHSSSSSNQIGMENHTYQLELTNIVVDPSNTPIDRIENENENENDVSHQSSSSNHFGIENHKERLELNNNILVDLSNASQLSNINEVDPSDEAVDSVPTNDANDILQGSTLRQRRKPSEPENVFPTQGIKTTESLSSPCAACKILRRRCDQRCVFAPYFPLDQPQKFIKVHRLFGVSNVAKILEELPFSQREHAVNSLEYEAEMRLQDPVYGCVGIIIKKLIEVIFSKVLTTADVTDELVIPMEALEHFPMVEGQHYVDLLVKEYSYVRQWKLGCIICSNGRPNPVLTSGWLEFVKENGVTMGDTVTLSKQNDDGGQYRFQVKNETRSLDFYVDFHHS